MAVSPECPEELRDITLYKGSGCKNCSNTGVRGRVAVFEVMPITENLKELILKGAPQSEIKGQTLTTGMATLRKNAINKMKQGLTTAEEVLRITFAD